MSETDWLSCADPLTMLQFLRATNRANDRKLRLLAVACSRRIWERIDDLGRAAVVVAEAFADGLAGDDELRAARHACRNAGESAAWYAAASNAFVAARNAALSAQAGCTDCTEAAAQAQLVRDMFGNPFRQS
jgi:hypothetical protein